jgi:hypothetical protein
MPGYVEEGGEGKGTGVNEKGSLLPVSIGCQSWNYRSVEHDRAMLAVL